MQPHRGGLLQFLDIVHVMAPADAETEYTSWVLYYIDMCGRRRRVGHVRFGECCIAKIQLERKSRASVKSRRVGTRWKS
jgi:hypothetical protein